MLKDAFAGDGFVSLNRALGQHDDPQHVLDFAIEHQQVVRGVNHKALLLCVTINNKILA